MATDYIVFIHGVNPREGYVQPTYADELFSLIQAASLPSSRALNKVALYWGDVNSDEEQRLIKAYQASPGWEKFWFRELREKQILQFTGSTALYISPYVGAKLAERLKEQIVEELSRYQPASGDRLHLVTHGLGMVILFDMLFSDRWDQLDMPGYESVRTIRQAVYGIEPNRERGVRLASISTMGAPIGLFSLMNVDASRREKTTTQGNAINTHDIIPRLERLLESLYRTQRRKLPWRNFAHPGDPLASPIVVLLPNLIDETSRYLDVQDVIIRSVDLSNVPMQPSSQSLFALLYSGVAHNSYWQSEEVAQEIARTIQSESISGQLIAAT